MKTQKIELRLDDAITDLLGGATVEAVAREFPDVAELVGVTEQLQALAPTPRLRLDAGRRRFLTEAARLQEQRAVRVPLWGRMLPRSAFTLAAVALLILIVGSTIAIAARAVVPNLPRLPILLNAPTATPTQTEIPTLTPTEPPASATPSPSPTPTQQPEPTDTPVPIATQTAPVQATVPPKSLPTMRPTSYPTDHSMCCPTNQPNWQPTSHPNWQPTNHPNWHPTDHPNWHPTQHH